MQYAHGAVETTLDLRSYRLTAVKKASYRLANRCTTLLGSASGEALPVTFSFRSGVTESAALDTVRAFFEELLDQELREQIAEETGPLRMLILAHAFSKIDLVRRD